MTIEADICKKLVSGLATEKERLIKNAISHQIGNDDWTVADITGRGEFHIHPDKTETFCFDGVPLINFGNARTVIDNECVGIQMSAEQDYKLLYA